MLVLPVPAIPDRRMLLPRVVPSAQHGVEPFDAGGDAFVRDLSVQPAPRLPARPRCRTSSMRNGYSLVPWFAPRYLTTRIRRVVP